MKSIHSYTYVFHNIHMNINTFDLFELTEFILQGVDARAITIQREQYGGTVYLFIGTGRSPGKNTFMTSIYIHNRHRSSGINRSFPF
jgi:hypothetical protein